MLKLVVLGTLEMPAYAKQNQQNEIVEKSEFHIYVKESTWSLTSFLRYYTFKNRAIWLNNNLRTEKEFAAKHK